MQKGPLPFALLGAFMPFAELRAFRPDNAKLLALSASVFNVLVAHPIHGVRRYAAR
jgi:hypothetical protein